MTDHERYIIAASMWSIFAMISGEKGTFTVRKSGERLTGEQATQKMFICIRKAGLNETEFQRKDREKFKDWMNRVRKTLRTDKIAPH